MGTGATGNDGATGATGATGPAGSGGIGATGATSGVEVDNGILKFGGFLDRDTELNARRDGGDPNLNSLFFGDFENWRVSNGRGTGATTTNILFWAPDSDNSPVNGQPYIQLKAYNDTEFVSTYGIFGEVNEPSAGTTYNGYYLGRRDTNNTGAHSYIRLNEYDYEIETSVAGTSRKITLDSNTLALRNTTSSGSLFGQIVIDTSSPGILIEEKFDLNLSSKAEMSSGIIALETFRDATATGNTVKDAEVILGGGTVEINAYNIDPSFSRALVIGDIFIDSNELNITRTLNTTGTQSNSIELNNITTKLTFVEPFSAIGGNIEMILGGIGGTSSPHTYFTSNNGSDHNVVIDGKAYINTVNLADPADDKVLLVNGNGEIVYSDSIGGSGGTYQKTSFSLTSWGANSTASFAHGMSSTPDWYNVVAICTTANGGYSVGDEIELDTSQSYVNSGNAIGFNISQDSTNTTFRTSNNTNPIRSFNNTNGNTYNITPANWDIRIDVYKGGVSEVVALPRVSEITSTTSLTIDADSTDTQIVSDLSSSLSINAPSGTPAQGQRLIIRILDNGSQRTLNWTTSTGGFREIGVTLPITTAASKHLYIGCIYNATDDFWDVVAINQQS